MKKKCPLCRRADLIEAYDGALICLRESCGFTNRTATADVQGAGSQSAATPDGCHTSILEAGTPSELCEWPACAAPALCRSGNFNDRLVCAEHFKITNGTPSERPQEPG